MYIRKECGIMTIINAKKGNTVIISKAKYNGLLETVHLIYVPKIKERFEKDLSVTE
mgnify:CR=1 FL=1